MDFSDHQIRYDHQREFAATTETDCDSTSELEEVTCEVMDSEFFPTFEELHAFGFTRKKYEELASIRAQSIIDKQQYGFSS